MNDNMKMPQDDTLPPQTTDPIADTTPQDDTPSSESLRSDLRDAIAEINKLKRIVQSQTVQIKQFAATVTRLLNANLTLTETLADARAANSTTATEHSDDTGKTPYA